MQPEPEPLEPYAERLELSIPETVGSEVRRVISRSAEDREYIEPFMGSRGRHTGRRRNGGRKP